MTSQITAGEVDRRVDRLEAQVLGALGEISRKLDDAVVLRREYAVDVGHLRDEHTSDVTHLRARIEEAHRRIGSLIARIWWITGILASAILSVAGAVIVKTID